MSRIVRNVAAAFTLGLVLGTPIGMASASSAAHRTFEGRVTHASATHFKVAGRAAGKDETLGFDYIPRPGEPLATGDRVRVSYDQPFLGSRRADSVEIVGGSPPER